MEIVIAVLGCTAFWQLIDHLIAAHRKKKFDIDQAVQDIQKDLAVMQDNQASMQKGLTKAERDSVRTQLLLLMSDYPDNTEEIMGVAEHYFHVKMAEVVALLMLYVLAVGVIIWFAN